MHLPYYFNMVLKHCWRFPPFGYLDPKSMWLHVRTSLGIYCFSPFLGRENFLVVFKAFFSIRNPFHLIKKFLFGLLMVISQIYWYTFRFFVVFVYFSPFYFGFSPLLFIYFTRYITFILYVFSFPCTSMKYWQTKKERIFLLCMFSSLHLSEISANKKPHI